MVGARIATPSPARCRSDRLRWIRVDAVEADAGGGRAHAGSWVPASRSIFCRRVARAVSRLRAAYRSSNLSRSSARLASLTRTSGTGGRQREVLRWIADCCPDGVMQNHTYKTTAVALQADTWSQSPGGAVSGTHGDSARQPHSRRCPATAPAG